MQSASSAGELRDVHVYIYTKATGLLGRMMGRNLKLEANRFHFNWNWTTRPNEPQWGEDAGKKVRALQSVVIESDSMSAISDVNEYELERDMLTTPEREKVETRMKSVKGLDTKQFPTIQFDVQHESANAMEGMMHIKGKSHPVHCTKEYTLDNLMYVRCPVDRTKFDVETPTAFLSLLSVGNMIDVVAQVPMPLARGTKS